MKTVFKELLNFKMQIFIIFLTVVGNALCTLSLPNYLSEIIDFGIANNNMQFVYHSGTIMFFITLTGMAFSIITGFYAAKISMKLGEIFRNIIFEKIQNFSLEQFDKFSTSSLITRTNNDVTQIQNFIVMFLRVILMAPVMCVGGIIMAFNKNAAMSSVIFLSIPALVLFIYLISRRAIPLSTRMQQKIDRVNLVMRENLTGIRVVRAFVTEDYETKRFRSASLDLMDNSLHMQRTIAFMDPILMLILNTTVVCLLCIGGFNVRSGNIMAGDIIAIIQYVMQIMFSVTMMSIIFVMYPRAEASAKRIEEVLYSKSSIIEAQNPRNSDKLKGHVCFKNVTFYFSEAEYPAIKNISFETNPGETTAIIGSTGSGKSALVKLILRLYDATEGEVLVDGINVKEYDKHVLREKIGYVPQKALLFKGSIKENIAFGDKNVDLQRIKAAAQIAQATDFIDKKEGKFDSDVSQGGSNFSGGQKQRLSISRAIARKPEIYIFDDSFSALDFKTEAALRSALSSETKNAAVIIVAQRVSTIINADRIIVLDKGQAVGIGKHEQLLKNCSVYQEIVHSQLSREEAGA